MKGPWRSLRARRRGAVVGRAQARYDAIGPRVPDRRGNDELGALMLTAGTYGFRSGTMLNYALDLRADDSWAYWVASSLLGAASLVGAVLIERRFPMRRGRGLSAGTAMLLGQGGHLRVRTLPTR